VFTIGIWSDSGGSGPGAQLHAFELATVNRMDTGDLTRGYPLFDYSVDVVPVTLDAETVYWLSIENDATSHGGDYWGWSRSSLDGTLYYGPGTPDTPFASSMSFQLTGSRPIPEPSAALLFAVGGVVVMTRRRYVPRSWGF
jgi:hypothetical protein